MPMPFPSALKSFKEKSNDSHLLEVFKDVVIIVLLFDGIQNISSLKFVKELCTPISKPKRVHLSKSVS